MFKDSLEKKLKKIFAVKKVSFAEPGDSNEQDCIFVEIADARNRCKDKRIISKVTGSISVYGNDEKLSFGYFSKAIEQASAADKKDLAFFDLEKNAKIFQNVVQRSVSFVYFFSTQYDPNVGSIESVNISIEVNP